MNNKFIAILFALILATTTALATPTFTSTAPTTNEVLYGGTAYTIDFNFFNDDSNGILATIPQKVSIYYSTIVGSRSYLVITDTNLTDRNLAQSDNGTIRCADWNNYGGADRCTYTWTVPGTGTLPSGKYYLDYNYQYQADGTGALSDVTGSSAIFEVRHPVSASMVSMIAIALFIAACALAVVAAFGLLNGMDIRTFVQMLIGVLIALIVAWTMYLAVLV